MAEDHDKNESESESETMRVIREIIPAYNKLIGELEVQLSAIEKRVIRMERAYDALGRRLEGSERHVEDEGWFD